MAQIVCPNKLLPGDTVAIVAPSEPVEREDVTKTKAYLEGLGYKVKLGKHLFYKIGDYTAGTIEDRAEDVNWAFGDPEIKAIFAGQGGYAADQILDRVDYEAVSKNPKIFVGYSDATTLQFALFAKANLVTFSGPNGAGLHEQDKYTYDYLWPPLTGFETPKIIPAEGNKWEVLRSGKGRGLLIGGNLDCICSLLGTIYDPLSKLTDQKIILFWEEDESIFNDIIRDMFQLKNAGVLERCEGILVGKITNSSEEGGYVGIPELRYTLLQLARAFDFPIIWNMDFGHVPAKITIPQGVEGEIDTKTLTIKFQNGVL